jgi:hypothetical protein
MKIRMLAGAAAVAALIATPAMAQQTQERFAGPQHHAANSTGVKKMKKMQQSRLNERGALARQDRLEDRRSSSGFWPADVAAGVVGGAIGTAGAIAAAPFTPFRGDSYAYYRDASTGRGFIADANGPKCLPGQVTTINGQKMRCQ